ncbi:hypothetical protein U1Q18_015060 [Sarracenia purpurea var. burkii]
MTMLFHMIFQATQMMIMKIYWQLRILPVVLIVKSAEELHHGLSQMLCCSDNILDDVVHEEISPTDTGGSGEIDRSLQNQLELKELPRMVKYADQFQDFDTLSGKLDSERRLNKFTPLYQRVLSALIVEDEIEEFEENGMGRNISIQYATNDLCCNVEPRKRDRMEIERESTFGTQTWKQCAGNKFVSFNGSDTPGRNSVIQIPPQNDELLQGENGFVYYSEVGALTEISGNDLDGTQIVHANGFSISSIYSPYEKTCLEDKLLLELQSIGIHLNTVPDLDDKEDEAINEDIVQLKKGLHQQIGKKKACLDKVYKAIQQGKEAETRQLEQVAMDKLVELSYKKLLATRGSIASRCGIPKVSKQVALAFAKRTLARCRAFDDSGTSCFNDPALRDAISAIPPHRKEAEPRTCDVLRVGSFQSSTELHDIHKCSLDPFENFTHQSDQAFAKNGPISNRWKKKELLLDDVGGIAALRSTSSLATTLLGGAKGKRSEREREKDVSGRNTVTRAGRPSLSNFKGERKSKTKPKQRMAQLSTSGNGFVNKYTETKNPVYPSATGSGHLVVNGSNNKRELGLMSLGTLAQESSKETKEAMDFTNLQLSELDSIDELGVGSDLGGHQDLGSWLNIDEDGLQDPNPLAIPMDDLSELIMY